MDFRYFAIVLALGKIVRLIKDVLGLVPAHDLFQIQSVRVDCRQEVFNHVRGAFFGLLAQQVAGGWLEPIECLKNQLIFVVSLEPLRPAQVEHEVQVIEVEDEVSCLLVDLRVAQSHQPGREPVIANVLKLHCAVFEDPARLAL